MENPAFLSMKQSKILPGVLPGVGNRPATIRKNLAIFEKNICKIMIKKALCAIAACALLAACTPAPKVNYKVWHDWPERFLPDFSTLGEPAVQGVKTNLDLTGLDDNWNHYCALFETVLKVDKEEEYNFTLTTDDGSKLYIDGELLIVNDGAHGPIEKKVSKVLAKGKHDLRIEYFDFDKGQSLVFRYSSPSVKDRELNDRAIFEEDRLSKKHAFVKPQVKEACKRYKEWTGDDETLVYPILTDVHTAGRFSYRHIGYAATAAKAFGADFMVNLGDIGLNAYPATVDCEYARWIMTNTREQMEKYDGVWLYAPGNHDWDAGEGKFNSEEFLSDFFQKPWEGRAGGNLHLTPGKTYGYYDIPAKNFRIIFLNSEGTGTQEGFYYYFDDPQIAWLRELLSATPADTHVIVMAHYMPHPMGRWTISKDVESTREGNEKLMAALSEFAENGGALVGMITGDSHTNDYARYNGVNYFISQGYGWVVQDLMLPTNRHAFFDYKETLCIDVVAVKPAKREVHTFRIGAGGADFDYEFTY
jgi:hypothetical protein